jgi:serine phosphatase RsbU (regulator of sigma subunit)
MGRTLGVMFLSTLTMLIKMSAITALYVILTVLLWSRLKNQKLSLFMKILLGIVYGGCSVLSTHFGVDYGFMLLNLRDVAPLSAGLFFDPLSGVIAGLIGGIERFIAGTYWGIGTYTRYACSISTGLAGFVALAMNVKVFEGKKPSPVYAFFMGAVMEVYHMYVVFITHRDDMRMAFKVVSTCSVAMIFFTGLALAITSLLLQILSGEYKKRETKLSGEDVSVSQTFQKMLFIVTALVIISNFVVSYIIMTQTASQDGKERIIDYAKTVKERYLEGLRLDAPGSAVLYEIIDEDGKIVAGKHKSQFVESGKLSEITSKIDRDFFSGALFGEESLNKVTRIDSEVILLTYTPNSELYWYRNAQAYETALADVLLFAIIYVLTAYLVQQIVVSNIERINSSLDKITGGDLNEVVDVRNSLEFASLSDDINETVEALKGYIDAAEKRMEQELLFARTIQASSLPRNFAFPGREDIFEIYASMNAAKEVGGDFYDFFFVGMNKLALVIADVSGKGIPAALFMMKSKTAIRNYAEAGGTPAEILSKANATLCDGNDAEMFVTVWLGIIDLETGVMSCSNAGHEYPLIMRAGGEFELLKDKHSMALAAIEGLKAKEYEITLNPGDKLFVYTDGIPEAINEEVEQYGTDRLTDAINQVKDKSFTETLPVILDDVFKFKGKADQFDDITMLGFDFKKYVG